MIRSECPEGLVQKWSGEISQKNSYSRADLSPRRYIHLGDCYQDKLSHRVCKDGIKIKTFTVSTRKNVAKKCKNIPSWKPSIPLSIHPSTSYSRSWSEGCWSRLPWSALANRSAHHPITGQTQWKLHISSATIVKLLYCKLLTLGFSVQHHRPSSLPPAYITAAKMKLQYISAGLC